MNKFSVVGSGVNNESNKKMIKIKSFHNSKTVWEDSERCGAFKCPEKKKLY